MCLTFLTLDQFLAKGVVQPIKTYSLYEPFHRLTWSEKPKPIVRDFHRKTKTLYII